MEGPPSDDARRERLKPFEALLAQGLITPEEFEAERRKLSREIAGPRCADCGAINEAPDSRCFNCGGELRAGEAAPAPATDVSAQRLQAPTPAAGRDGAAVRPHRWPIVAAGLLLLALAAGGLVLSRGTGEEPLSATAGPKPTVRIASFVSTESVILGELYGQTLAASGYTVEYKHRLVREFVFRALEEGDIDFVPEYLAAALAFATKSATTVGDAAEAHKQLQAAVKDRRLTVLDFASAVNTSAFVVTKATADNYRLKKMSDLVPVAGQLTLGAPPTCPQRPSCLPGLEQTYGIKFKEFRALDSGGPMTVAALRADLVDVALLSSTDPNISVMGFVLLEDDKRLQAANNVAPLVRDDLVAKGGDDFKRLVNGVSAKLTTAELSALNNLVGVDKKDATEVAADWLKKQGLVK